MNPAIPGRHHKLLTFLGTNRLAWLRNFFEAAQNFEKDEMTKKGPTSKTWRISINFRRKVNAGNRTTRVQIPKISNHYFLPCADSRRYKIFFRKARLKVLFLINYCYTSSHLWRDLRRLTYIKNQEPRGAHSISINKLHGQNIHFSTFISRRCTKAPAASG